jgi:hypothetical protein
MIPQGSSGKSQAARCLFILTMALSLALATGHADDRTPLVLERTVALPGVKGRIDHLAVDLAGQRLFVAALGNNTVEVLDCNNGKRLHSFAGLAEPQDVFFIPEFNKIFVTSGGDGSCKIFDGSSFDLLDTISFSDDADNLRYDPQARDLYVGYGAGALGRVEAKTGKRLGDVRLEGHPEAFQLEQAGSKIYVNVPTAGHVAVIDRQRLTVLATWPLKEARHNFPMALAEASHRLFIGCRTPAKIIIYDTDSGQSVGGLEIAGDVDDLFFDGKHKRLYASCGAGSLEVFQQTDSDHYTPLAKLPTARGARTCLLVPEQRRLYLAVPRRAGQPAEILIYTVSP